MSDEVAMKLVEDKIRKLLVPELELELLNVNALEWKELSKEEKESANIKGEQLLHSTISKILEVEHQQIQNKTLEKERKNLFTYRCTKCGNKDQNRFLEIEGSMICKGINDDSKCGYEILNYKPHEGNFYRNFDGEEDRSHHGKAFNPLYSEAWNSRTDISLDGMDVKSGSKLKAAMAKIEDELNNVNRDADDRRTRDSYRDKHKSKSFHIMEHAISNLSLHSSVMERAQYLFAIFRDDRDRVQRDKLVIAACLVIGYRENVQYERKSLLNQQASEDSISDESQVSKGTDPEQAKKYKAEQKRMYNEVISGNQKRSKLKDDILYADKLGTKTSMKLWDENDVRKWLFNTITENPSFQYQYIQSHWQFNGKTGLNENQIDMILNYLNKVDSLNSNVYVDKIISKLIKSNRLKRSLGQCLLMCNAKLFNVCECESSENCFCEEIAKQMFIALKARKDIDMHQLSVQDKGKSSDTFSRKCASVKL